MYNNFSNWSTHQPEFPPSQFRPSIVIPNNYESPITNPPQNMARNHGVMTLNQGRDGSHGVRNNSNEVFNGLGNFTQPPRSETQSRDFRSWLRRTNHPVRNENSYPSDSVVINFDNINEPSASSKPEPFYAICPSQGVSNQYNLQNSSMGSSGEGNENQNLPHYGQDSNTVTTSTSSSNNGVTHSHLQEVRIPVTQNNNNEVAGSQSENSNINVSSETQTIDRLLQKYIPIITFLLAKAIYDHREGILIFVGLLITFIHANSVVKREIAKQSRRSLLSLSMLLVNLFVCICFVYFVFQEQRLYKSLVFIPPYTQPLSIWDLLWMVGITDFVLKFITIQLKAGMACFPGKLLPYSTRGKWYLMLERVSQLYRGLAPIQPWLYYLMEAYQGPEKIVGVFFSVAYMISKGTDLMSKAKLFLKAFGKLLENVNLGVRPSKEELDTAGSQCPICHDEYNAPILLHCRHVFCEECVTTWFDREQTCPLCRAKVADDPSWRDGATSFFTQLF